MSAHVDSSYGIVKCYLREFHTFNLAVGRSVDFYMILSTTVGEETMNNHDTLILMNTALACTKWANVLRYITSGSLAVAGPLATDVGKNMDE